MRIDVLVVGAGFAGSVIAERCAASGRSVLVIDKRGHVGGNAYDYYDDHGILVHRYGPHIFHTNASAVVSYLSRFTEWIPYEHRVLAEVRGVLYPIPINRTTINTFFSLNLATDQLQYFMESIREPRPYIRTSEDQVLATVGRDLCDSFYRGYTRKQWGLELSELDASVTGRVTFRNDDDDRYFTDTFQKMPAQGYTALFRRLLNHSNIHIELGVNFEDVAKRINWEHLVYTGPIDEYFGFCLGRLPYRSLRFDHSHIAHTDKLQKVGTINYPNDHNYTRVTEFKHLTSQIHDGTSIVREFPTATGDPYYPIPRPANHALYKQYRELAMAEAPKVLFVGRLGQYQYFNMDQVVAAALKASERIVGQSAFAI